VAAPGGTDPGGEAWDDFVARAGEHAAAVGSTPQALFEAFRTSAELTVIFATFAALFHAATSGGSSPPWRPAEMSGKPWQFPYEPIRLLLAGNWKAKALWEKLDRRQAKAEFEGAPCAGAGSRLDGRRIVIVGAGPCGLYAAIELRLLGARVTVVERRTSFSRINQLHLWKWCFGEIKDLGAKCLEPPPVDFGANPDLYNISISDLQALLLKTALLFGVEVMLGAEFNTAAWDGGWCVQLNRSSCSHAAGPSAHVPDGSADAAESGGGALEVAGIVRASPDPPKVLEGVAAVIGTDGLNSVVSRFAGIEVAELGCLRGEDAIGLVVNFALMPGKGSRALRSFALASQFYEELFKRLAATTGAELENVVYTKSKASHYFVMTPTRRCLVRCGALRDGQHKPLLSKENVDRQALNAFVRRVVSFKFKDSEPTLQEAAADGTGDGEGSPDLAFADSGPQLFDFSKLRRASSGLVFLPSPAGDGSVDPLPVALAGDALLEPFWPEGLGIVRGFLSALDVSSAMVQWARGADEHATQQHFAAAFAQLKTLGARTRGTVLRLPEEKHFALAPSTRYRSLASQPAAGDDRGLPA